VIVDIDTPPAIQELRGFECTPEAVGAERVVGDLHGGEKIVIQPAEGADCMYHLVHKGVTGNDTKISSGPGGYLFAVTWSDPIIGDLGVCGTNIHHEKVEGRYHEIDTAALECAFRVKGNWTEMGPVVPADTGFATWPRRLLDPGDGTLVLEYARDSSFNLLNLSDTGRPATDGIYQIVLTVQADGVAVSPAEKINNSVTVASPDSGNAWVPTEEEKAELGDLIDFSAAASVE
jgi:hypothetical protein